MLKIEEGKFYKDGYNRVFGPMKYLLNTGEYVAGSSRFNSSGRYSVEHVSRLHDLVAECAEPPVVVQITHDIKSAIAHKAVEIVGGSRQKDYGTPEDNFERIARFWQAYFLNTGRDIKITAGDVSPLMRLLKEARLCATPDHADSHVDLVGYALTGADIAGVKL